MILYSVPAIRQEIGDHLQELKDLRQLAEDENRELTPEEEARFEEVMDIVGEDGDKPTGLHKKLASALKFERISNANSGGNRPLPAGAAGLSAPDEQPARIRVTNRFGRLKAFKGDDGAAVAQATGHWLRASLLNHEGSRDWCANNFNGIFNVTHNEGTDSQGGYLVPDPVAATIIDVVERFAVLRPLCRVVPMTSDTLKVPKRLTGLTVDYPGEATAITESNKTWGQVSLTAVKRSVLAKFSYELRDDALIAVADDLIMEIGRAFGNQEDNEIVNGDGSGTYGSETGILSALHANAKNVMGSGDTAFSNIAMTDIHATTALLPEKYHPMASWLMRRSTWQENVQSLLYASGGTAVQDFGDGPRASLLGYPVEFTDQMPTSSTSTAAALFGSFRDGVMIGDRGNYEVMTSEHRYFEEDAIGMKAGRRYDINVHSTGSAATDRAIVGLYTAAS